MNDEGLADARAANPFALSRLHPGIGFCVVTPAEVTGRDRTTGRGRLPPAESTSLSMSGVQRYVVAANSSSLVYLLGRCGELYKRSGWRLVGWQVGRRRLARWTEMLQVGVNRLDVAVGHVA